MNHSIYSDLLNQAITFAGTLLFIALTALVAKLRQRAATKISQDQESAFDQIIQRGIAFAEEAARKKVGELKLTGDDKLGIALKFVLSQIDAQGLEKKAEDAIKDRIHAALGSTRKLDPMLDIAVTALSAFTKPPVEPPTEPVVLAPVPTPPAAA